MKTTLYTLLLLLSTFTLTAQRSIRYDVSLSGQISNKNPLPFWSTANKYGITPNSRGGLLQAGIFSDFNPLKNLQFAFGISGAGYLSQGDNNILFDELYASIKWEKLRLDLGMIHPQTDYNGLSSTNGNLTFSGNVRTMPGYNLRTEFITIPFTRQILSFKFNWADYSMIDDRFVDKTRLHNKSLFLNIKPISRLDIIVGIEHWVQWAGKSSGNRKQPSSFRDYVRVFWGREGGVGATVSDSLNALGNHLGREHIRINYHADNYTLTFYHDIPFEDGSGTRFANFPDGVYGLYYGAKNRKQWISDIMYEFYYTKSQSGPSHQRPTTDEEKKDRDPNAWNYDFVILGGNDDYFNNGEYKSGWTYYGRTIGSPFMTPQTPDANGLTLGVYNNRILAHYLGIQGYAWHKIPYRLRLAYSINYGRHSQALPDTPKQFSCGLEAGLLNKEKSPLHIDLGVYGDFGKLLKNNIGFTLTLKHNGKIK